MAGLFDRLQSEIERREKNEGLTPLDLLDLEPEVSRLVQALARQGDMRIAAMAEVLGMPVDEAEQVVDGLVEKGMVKSFDVKGERHYRAYLARKPGQALPLDIWAALEEKAEEESS